MQWVDCQINLGTWGQEVIAGREAARSVQGRRVSVRHTHHVLFCLVECLEVRNILV